jgi:hypothetical protein
MTSRIVRTVALAPVIVGLVAVTLLTAGCRHEHADTAPIPVSSPTVAPVAGPIAFHVRLGAGQHLTTWNPKPYKCPEQVADVDLNSHHYVTLLAFATSCGSEGNTNPGNGRHGVYRTNEDIPAERRSSAQTVHTALGDALVFTQPYFECTNACYFYTEPVAVITLAQPQEKAVQSLMVVSPKGSMDQDALAAFVREQLLA